MTRQIDNVKIAHIVPDNMFVDHAYWQFETISPGSNTFFTFKRKSKVSLIKEIPLNHITLCDLRTKNFWNHIQSYDFVVIHSLSTYHKEFIARSPYDIVLVWIGMGFDYYDLIFEKDDLYLPVTKSLLSAQNELGFNIKDKIKQKAKNYFFQGAPKKELIKKLDYFAPVLPVEYGIVKSKSGEPFPEQVNWNYCASNRLAQKDEPAIEKCASNIIVGNSATPENNHLDMFHSLAKLNFNQSSSVVCPLTYGRYWYRNQIVKAGKSLLGKTFSPLQRHLPINEYLNLFNNCNSLILNSVRQIGGGNVSAMLFKGGKVFLRKENPLLSHYQEQGAVLFSEESIHANPGILTEPLFPHDAEHNRQIITDLRNNKACLEKTHQLVELAASKKACLSGAHS